MKTYTTLEDSKKLAKILPVETADMYFSKYDTIHAATLYFSRDSEYFKFYEYIPCWSLVALLEIIRNNGIYQLQMYEGGYCLEGNEFMTEIYFNAIDACYEMIIYLHELNLL